MKARKMEFNGTFLSQALWKQLGEFRKPSVTFPYGQKIKAVTAIREETGLSIWDAEAVLNEAWPILTAQLLERLA